MRKFRIGDSIHVPSKRLMKQCNSCKSLDIWIAYRAIEYNKLLQELILEQHRQLGV